MRLQFRDYGSNDQYERDKAGEFDGSYAQCTSIYVNAGENISISEQQSSGKFQVVISSTDKWFVGCQHILVIATNQNEEVYKSPFVDILIDGTAEIEERVRSVREDLLALQANGWPIMTDEEKEIKKYIDDCDNSYMPDIF